MSDAAELSIVMLKRRHSLPYSGTVSKNVVVITFIQNLLISVNASLILNKGHNKKKYLLSLFRIHVKLRYLLQATAKRVPRYSKEPY